MTVLLLETEGRKADIIVVVVEVLLYNKTKASSTTTNPTDADDQHNGDFLTDGTDIQSYRFDERKISKDEGRSLFFLCRR